MVKQQPSHHPLGSLDGMHTYRFHGTPMFSVKLSAALFPLRPVPAVPLPVTLSCQTQGHEHVIVQGSVHIHPKSTLPIRQVKEGLLCRSLVHEQPTLHPAGQGSPQAHAVVQALLSTTTWREYPYPGHF